MLHHFETYWHNTVNIDLTQTLVFVISSQCCLYQTYDLFLVSGLLSKVSSLLAQVFDRRRHRSNRHLQRIYTEIMELLWRLWCISFSFGWSVLQWCYWTHISPSGLCSGAVWVRSLWQSSSITCWHMLDFKTVSTVDKNIYTFLLNLNAISVDRVIVFSSNDVNRTKKKKKNEKIHN